MNWRAILVIGDLHLGRAAHSGTEEAVVALLEQHPHAELVCLGDTFDLSAETGRQQADESVLAHLNRFSRLARALRNHLAAGCAVTLVVGNHDAELGAKGVRVAVLRHLDLPVQSHLTIAPWWIRRFGLHLEHGHVWDPDNAPIHPLVPTDRVNEPLGVALTRQVLAPMDAYEFAHAHQTTPLAGLLRALRELQLRAPEVILRYFVAGARILWRASSHAHAATRRAGDRSIDAYARQQGLEESVVEQLIRLRPKPRHADFAAAFARLYIDRAAATVATVVSAATAIAQRESSYLLVAALGVLYLGCSRGDRIDRYSTSLEQRMEAAAIGILPVVGARAVVFGHTHVAVARSGYVNVGAFGVPSERGRPYLLLGDDQRISRGWLGGTSELESLDRFVSTEECAAGRDATG
jgi:UDP-2,3-diacylglucosamine pyrophosphatase LpxH